MNDANATQLVRFNDYVSHAVVPFEDDSSSSNVSGTSRSSNRDSNTSDVSSFGQIDNSAKSQIEEQESISSKAKYLIEKVN